MSGVRIVDGRLRIDGVDALGVAERFGTPVYIYGGDSIAAGVGRLREVLGDEVGVYYSVKANPAVGVCRVIRGAGVDGAEIASSGELVAAVAAGFDAGDILFAGPGKTDDELRRAIGIGVGQINAESVGELERIERIAGSMGCIQRVGVRVNIEESGVGRGKIRTGGGAQKFGIDESGVVEAVGLIESLGHVEFAGLHTMLGSQVLDAGELLGNCARSIEMAERVCKASGVEIGSLNFGGGLGVGHSDDDGAFDLEAFGRGLVGLIGEARAEGTFARTRFVIEPGRLLVSAHGVYLSRVVDVKNSGGERFAVMDGGIHHALLPITANQYEMVVVDRCGKTDETELVRLGGPLCTSADQWRSGVELPGVRVGDVVGMMNSGAYGLSASMTMFLSRGVAAEVLVVDGEQHVIRSRSVPEDVLVGQEIPGELGGPMEVIETVEGMRAWAERGRSEGASVGFVATQGCLHAGHAELLRRARRDHDRVVLSVFVNPLQFRRGAYEVYPRQIESDLRIARAHGVDAVFLPDAHAMYPEFDSLDGVFELQDGGSGVRDGEVFTVDRVGKGGGLGYVRVPGRLVMKMDGVDHPWHFDGVATVVRRLFEIIQPKAAYFGEKDVQQLAILEAMNRWMGGGVEIVPVPVVRDGDGLSLSSRLTRLDSVQRGIALEVTGLVERFAVDAAGGVVDTKELRERFVAGFGSIDARGCRLELDSVVCVDAVTLEPVERISGVAVVYAAFVIDGIRLAESVRVVV